MSVDRGKRWRDRKRNDTHYTQNQMGGEGRAKTERCGREGIRKTRKRFAENNGLRKTGIGTYCSLENQSLVSVQLEKNDPLKNSLILSLLMFDICKDHLLFVHCIVTQKELKGTA